MGLLVKGFFFQFNHYFVFKKDNRNLAVPELNQHCEESPKNYLCEHCGQMIENSGTDTKHLCRNHARVLETELKIFKCVECSFNCDTRANLNIAVTENHNDVDIEREQCGNFFVSRKELNYHRPTQLLTQGLSPLPTCWKVY